MSVPAILAVCAVMLTVGVLVAIVELVKTLREVRRTTQSVDLLARELAEDASLARESLNRINTMAGHLEGGLGVVGNFVKAPALKAGQVALAVWRGIQWWRERKKGGKSDE